MKIKGMDWLLLRLVPSIGSLWLKFLGFSMCIEFQGDEKLRALNEQGKNIIFAFWHGRQLMMPIGFRDIALGKNPVALISMHRDGEYISRTISKFGINSVRGSTSRGASKGLRQLIGALKGGVDVGITPDGPRGPKYKAQMGVIQLAKLSGAPIVPVTFGAVKKKPSQAGIA